MMVMEACTGVASVIAMPKKLRSPRLSAQRQAMPLAVQTFKVADKEHPKINPRRNPGTAALLVVFSAEPLGEVIEAGLGQHLIDFAVKWMAGTSGQFGGGDEQFLLLGFAFSKCHENQTVHPHSRSIIRSSF
jgi:hypothetical protein